MKKLTRQRALASCSLTFERLRCPLKYHPTLEVLKKERNFDLQVNRVLVSGPNDAKKYFGEFKKLFRDSIGSI